MKKLYFLITIFLLLSLQSVNAKGVYLKVNQKSLTTGDTLKISIGNTDEFSEKVDVYIAFTYGYGNALYFWPTFTLDPIPCVKSWLPVKVDAIEFFSYKFTGNEPECSYIFYAAFFKENKFTINDIIGDIGVVNFNFFKKINNNIIDNNSENHNDNSSVNPDDNITAETQDNNSINPGEKETTVSDNKTIMNVIPYDGQVFNTTNPTFIIEFKSSPDLNSIKYNCEINIESIKSGKKLRIYKDTNDGKLWIEYFNPEDSTYIWYKITNNEENLINLNVDGNSLMLHVDSVTIEGETFQLKSGGDYKFSIKFLSGAKLTDGTSLNGIDIGPNEFFIN